VSRGTALLIDPEPRSHDELSAALSALGFGVVRVYEPGAALAMLEALPLALAVVSAPGDGAPDPRVLTALRDRPGAVVFVVAGPEAGWLRTEAGSRGRTWCARPLAPAALAAACREVLDAAMVH
jgi:hypothetical protein